jgi:hypothetical protein
MSAGFSLIPAGYERKKSILTKRRKGIERNPTL